LLDFIWANISHAQYDDTRLERGDQVEKHALGVTDIINGNSYGNGKDNRNGNYGAMVIFPYKNESNDSVQKAQLLL
jgi:hypothetical protein